MLRIPTVKRLVADKERLHVWLPFREPRATNWRFLRAVLGGQKHIDYEAGTFRIGRKYLTAIVTAVATEFGAVQVTLQFRNTEKCDTRCQGANPDYYWDCECSCFGANHGGVGAGAAWFQVGETTLISSAIRQATFVVTREQVCAEGRA